MKLVINIFVALEIGISNYHQEDKFYEDLQERHDEVEEFFEEIDLQIGTKYPETDSGWYRKKIAKARTLIAKYEPAYSPQSQDVGSSSIHEELNGEISGMIRMKCADLITAHEMRNDDPDRYNQFEKELQESLNEVNKFLTEINLRLQEKTLEKNSDWYHDKIAESRVLVAKRYSAFPLNSQDEVYTKFWSQQHLQVS